MKIRITSSHEDSTRVFDAETGLEIKGLTAVRFEHFGIDKNPRVILEVLPESVEIEAEGDLTLRVRPRVEGLPPHVAEAYRRISEFALPANEVRALEKP